MTHSPELPFTGLEERKGVALFFLHAGLAGILTSIESYHTHDEALRGVDFISPVQPIGEKALEKVMVNDSVRKLTTEQRTEPHEYFGFAD